MMVCKRLATTVFYKTSIEEIIIPRSVKTIAYSAFEGCTKLHKVTLQEGLEQIGNNCFYNTNIKSVMIPNSVKTIGHNAFPDGCEKEKMRVCRY